jgi:hypothetical protein
LKKRVMPGSTPGIHIGKIWSAIGQGIAAYAGEGTAAKAQATAEYYPFPVKYGNFSTRKPPGTSSERRSSDAIYD